MQHFQENYKLKFLYNNVRVAATNCTLLLRLSTCMYNCFLEIEECVNPQVNRINWDIKNKILIAGNKNVSLNVMCVTLESS